MSLTEKCLNFWQVVMTCQFSYVCGSGQLPGFLHPVDSRMLCLPQTEVISIVFFRTKGSLV